MLWPSLPPEMQLFPSVPLASIKIQVQHACQPFWGVWQWGLASGIVFGRLLDERKVGSRDQA